MDVFDLVRTVLAVRQYQDRPVPDQVIRRIVEAGRLTASSINKPGTSWSSKTASVCRGSAISWRRAVHRSGATRQRARLRASRFGVSDAANATPL